MGNMTQKSMRGLRVISIAHSTIQSNTRQVKRNMVERFIIELLTDIQKYEFIRLWQRCSVEITRYSSEWVSDGKVECKTVTEFAYIEISGMSGIIG